MIYFLYHYFWINNYIKFRIGSIVYLEGIIRSKIEN